MEVIREEASGILEEMSHNLQLSVIRLLGYTLNKVFKSVFRRILVNEDGLNRVRTSASQQSCTLSLKA